MVEADAADAAEIAAKAAPNRAFLITKHSHSLKQTYKNFSLETPAQDQLRPLDDTFRPQLTIA